MRKMSNFVELSKIIKKRRGVQKIENIVYAGCATRPSPENRVALLNDAGEMYAALIAALHRAHHTIDLEYYIFDDDRIGRTISELLIRRAHHGVRVRVIYDLLGSWMPAWGMLRKLRKAGVEVRYFRPLKGFRLLRWINIRNHRKIAIVDGCVAFLGGINIARRYLEGTELGHWRDEHLKIEGGAASDLRELFQRDWRTIGGEASDQRRSPSTPHRLKGERTLIAWSEEGSSRGVMEQSLVELIRGARNEILLSTPYYIPTPPLREALTEALKRGVRVELMTPARADLRIATWAAESYYQELLALGGRIFRYKTGFLHTKMVLIDRRLSSIGTANLDYRSLRTNWEVAAFIDDESFGEKIAQTFSRDRNNCSNLNPEVWRGRFVLLRLRSRLARLFSRWL